MAGANETQRVEDAAKFADIPTRKSLLSPVSILLLMLTALVATRIFYAGTLVQFLTSLIAPLSALVGVGLWVVFFSRLPWSDRGLLAASFVVAIAVSSQILDLSMIPFGIIIYILPLMMLLPVIWLALLPGQFESVKRIGTYALLVAPVLAFVSMRIDGITGSMTPTVSFRWSPSAEDEYVALLAASKSAAKEGSNQSDAGSNNATPIVAHTGDWPEFRGPDRDGIARNTTLADDWETKDFKEVWRRPVGPGWSSFIVVDDRLLTQEQRGDEEAIVCMRATTGETAWVDTIQERFYEVVGNAGPRATPTFDSGRIYALGATGILTSLNAATGRRLWQVNMAEDTGATIPTWGFSSSPLVVDGNKVIVIAGDPGTKVIAYDADNGQILWQSLDKGLSYSSPQLLTLAGERQVVVMDGDGVFSLNPDSGDLLWSHIWKIPQAARIIQPLQVDEQTLLVGTGYGEGTRMLRITKLESQTNVSANWNVEELWTSRSMKPYFNDFVLHKGYLYGFDHEIVTCIDAKTGDRMWKKGRYGFGQLILEPKDEVLIVLGEQGELALLRATPDQAKAGEIRKIQALEGKTWNHPVLVQNRLYLRNAQEAVCYELASR